MKAGPESSERKWDDAMARHGGREREREELLLLLLLLLL